MAKRPVRARTLRRQQARLQAREVAEVKRGLGARGIYDRCAVVNAAVAPGNPLFWRVYKDRVAAREMIVPITKAVEARDIAVKALEELGVDLTDVVLKAEWKPPQMVFQAIPSYEAAMAEVTEVRGSQRGKARDRKLARIGHAIGLWSKTA